MNKWRHWSWIGKRWCCLSEHSINVVLNLNCLDGLIKMHLFFSVLSFFPILLCYNLMQQCLWKAEIENEGQLLDQILQSRSLAIKKVRASRQQFILIASLLDRIPNLAGLARTCEVCSQGFGLYLSVLCFSYLVHWKNYTAQFLLILSFKLGI